MEKKKKKETTSKFFKFLEPALKTFLSTFSISQLDAIHSPNKAFQNVVRQKKGMVV